MWIPRDIEPRLQRSARTRPVVVLTGARQTGKTSTLRRLFPDHKFVSLDLPTEAEQAEKEPRGFLVRHPPPVIIDEVQYAPGLFRYLKAASGGFPELHANPDIDQAAFYSSYLATYLERDVRTLANVGSLREFERFLRACAMRSANLLNKADLARDIGIAPSTANHWLSALGASGQVVLLEPWFSSRTKSIIKSPKLYLADSGLLCALLNIRSEEALRQSPAAGEVWETFLFAQLQARERRLGRVHGLFFWRDRTREVAFVADAAGRLELFEAKWSEAPDAGDTVNLAFLRNFIGKSHYASGYVLCRAAHSYPLGDGFRAVPGAEIG
jgi:predicted AAA+ superfamily ATPase